MMYRAQRDEARVLEAAGKLKAEEADHLILQLRNELLALQVALQERLSRLKSYTVDSLDAADAADDAISLPLSDIDLEEFSDSEAPELLQNDTNSSVDDEGYSNASDDDENDSDPSDDSDDYTTPSDDEESYAAVEGLEDELGGTVDRGAVLDFLEPSIQLNVLSFANFQDDYDELNNNDDDRAPTVPQSTTSRPSSSSLYSPPISLANVRQLMQLAHSPNESEALARIRSLVSHAHRTSPSLRTEVQKMLLAEWRRPPEPPSNHFLSSSDASGNPEAVYVDASGYGIGLFYRNQWQAWGLKEGWRMGRSREIQWAEAVAIELGIRMMVKDGYSGRTLTLHSDNLQVVEAVRGDRPMAEPHTNYIIDKIHALCRLHQIYLDISWIPGPKNPADGPSRLKNVEDQRTRISYDIEIPKHLQEFVIPYT
jgi:hypothetical protein